MDSLTKVVVLFAVLGIVGAGVFFFPQSPVHYEKLRVIIVNAGGNDTAAEDAAATEPAAEEEAAEPEMEMNN